MSLHTPPHVFKRIAVTLGLGVAFIVMASIFSPDRTRAAEEAPHRRAKPSSATRSMPGDSIDAHEGLRSLGQIETGRYIVEIYSTDTGPRYTVVARDSGEELGTLLTAKQVQQLLPEIDISAMDFSTPTENAPQQLMLAEPPSQVHE